MVALQISPELHAYKFLDWKFSENVGIITFGGGYEFRYYCNRRPADEKLVH